MKCTKCKKVITHTFVGSDGDKFCTASCLHSYYDATKRRKRKEAAIKKKEKEKAEQQEIRIEELLKMRPNNGIITYWNSGCEFSTERKVELEEFLTALTDEQYLIVADIVQNEGWNEADQAQGL